MTATATLDVFDVAVLPVSVRAVFRHPMDAEDEARKQRLILQATARGYTVASISNHRQTIVYCRREAK